MKDSDFTVAPLCMLGLFLVILFIIAINVQPDDEYKRCSIISKVKTGKTRPDVAMKFVGRQHETIITWKCASGEKLQVTWENH
ncbi:hypothetical protein [Castellaniella sp.]|uniref:hypothetical protein n=1 Tax=Castellaniella sp. TaxID=1955812 RepID=UPI002AFFE53B|nr:hypothetical protein [Castellaniella sp.]